MICGQGCARSKWRGLAPETPRATGVGPEPPQIDQPCATGLGPEFLRIFFEIGRLTPYFFEIGHSYIF